MYTFKDRRSLEEIGVENSGVLHAWEQICKDVNEFCSEYRIPNENMITLFRKEMEYISLYIHDVLPLNYNEQGINPSDHCISWYTKFSPRMTECS